MNMPPNLKAKYLARFEELIEEGLNVVASIKKTTHGGHRVEAPLGGYTQTRKVVRTSLDFDSAMEFQNKAKTLFANVLPLSHPNRKRLETVGEFRSDEMGVRSCVALLKATKNDFEHDFLEALSTKIEAEISSDYLGQAERLLRDGRSGQHEHIPAAVLAGAVLERGLRTLCDSQTPPISTVKPNGEPMTMNPLIDELKKAGIFNELRAKELRSWADTRNAAAHGEFQKFNREQVERMLDGISSFLAESL